MISPSGTVAHYEEKNFIYFSLGVFVIIAVAIGGFLFLKRGFEITISEAQIRAAVVAKFPYEKTHLRVLKITYADPVVELVDSSNRVRIGVTAVPHLTINGHTASGSIVATGGFRYEPELGQFFLTGFTIERIDINNTYGMSLSKLSSAVSDAFEDLYAKHPIYTLKDGDLKQSTAKMLVRDLRIADNVVHVRLGLK